jgi:hypothetical protein
VKDRDSFVAAMRRDLVRFPSMMLAEHLKQNLGGTDEGPMAGFLMGLVITLKSPRTAEAMLANLVDERDKKEGEEVMSEAADQILLDWAKWTNFAAGADHEETFDALYTLAKSLGFRI